MNSILPSRAHIDLPIKDIIDELLVAGQISTAYELQDRYVPTLDLTKKYILHGFASVERPLVSQIVTQSIRPDTRLGVSVIKKYLALAEVGGDVEGIRRALRLFQDYYIKSVESDSFAKENIKRPIVDFALHTHQYGLIEEINERSEDLSESVVLALSSVSRLKAMATRAGTDWRQLERATIAVRDGEDLQTNGPTVIVRISPRIWDHLAIRDEESVSVTDGFAFVQEIRKIAAGREVVIAPQYTNAGPTLFMPFSPRSDHQIIIVDHHKYSRKGLGVHYKSTVGGRQIVDFCGYSGWSELSVSPEIYDPDSIDADTAGEYCERVRSDLLNQYSDPPTIYDGRPYAFIPLQVGMDSVLSLAHIDSRTMVRMAIRHFHRQGLGVVIKRHPRCKSATMDVIIDEVSGLDGVAVETAPSPILVSQSKCVAMINSTVGLEAILFNKKLICFGESEYKPVCSTIHNQWELDCVDISPPSREESDKFYYFYHEKYLTFGRKPYVQRVMDKISALL